jgi:hypothetical protein
MKSQALPALPGLNSLKFIILATYFHSSFCQQDCEFQIGDDPRDQRIQLSHLTGMETEAQREETLPSRIESDGYLTMPSV